jgi:aflatoxin B1 aldehyde reductase
MGNDKQVQLILGTMTFGTRVDVFQAGEMLETALRLGIRELDTAYVYQNGNSEKVLGAALKSFAPNSFRIALKVSPKPTGRLDREAVKFQLETSLQRLGIGKADVLYIHFPNHTTPLIQTLEACMVMHDSGMFGELGLSNFPASLVSETQELCAARGWKGPTVYEGVYNAFSRASEALLPTLRAAGLRFAAYNPLAGGLLCGKYESFDKIPQTGRFADMPGYRDRYWKKTYFAGLSLVREACAEAGISMTDAAIRWLLFHSGLDAGAGDGVILGVSTLAQLQQNAAAVEHGPLPAPIVQAFEDGWLLCAQDAPSYYRFIG